MTTLHLMLFAWLICLLVFVALLVYRSHLERHEVSEVYLDENAEQDREAENDDLVRRVDGITPYVRTAGGATALLTLVVIAIYIIQIWPSVQFSR